MVTNGPNQMTSNSLTSDENKDVDLEENHPEDQSSTMIADINVGGKLFRDKVDLYHFLSEDCDFFLPTKISFV